MNALNRINGRRWGVVALYLATIFVNYASTAFLFGDSDTGDVSDKYSTLFTPAGYAFSIWGLIYLALGIYVFYQAFWARQDQNLYDRLAPWLMVNLLFNSLWLPTFQYELIALSVVFMLVILGTLVQLQIILTQDTTLAPRERAWVRVPFSLYLGWISVATITNLAVFVKYSGWEIPNASESTWVVIMAVVGALLAFLVARATRDWIYPLVFVWAYVAIAVKQSDNDLIYPAALGLAAALAVLSAVTLVRNQKKERVAA
ncbi:MAG: TspO/MBR family protein [Tunicatimonas sp.]